LGTGRVTDCPAYLSVTVNDRRVGEELCHYDTLISCPPQFNITITVPPGPPQSSSGVTGGHRVFEVVLHDSKIEQRVFLSTFVARHVEDGQIDTSLSGPIHDSFKYGGKNVKFALEVAEVLS